MCTRTSIGYGTYIQKGNGNLFLSYDSVSGFHKVFKGNESNKYIFTLNKGTLVLKKNRGTKYKRKTQYLFRKTLNKNNVKRWRFRKDKALYKKS